MTGPRVLPSVRAPEPTEREFTDQVLQMLATFGWQSLHIRPGRTATSWRTPVAGNGKGFPDILAIRRERIVVAELKVGRNKLTEEQRDWLHLWQLARAEVFEWRPEDFQSIAQVLR